VKWKRVRGKRGRDVIDVRGASPPSGRGSGGLPIPGGLAGIGGGAGIVVVLVILAIQLFGGGEGGGFDIDDVFGPAVQAPGADAPGGALAPGEDPDRELFEFSKAVFVDVQKTWAGTFRQDGASYDDAQLIVYSNAVETGGCGGATSAVGPFYCPADSRVYLDLSFYDDMRRQLQASGDFAWAYVIAHEVGHHVQNLTGTDEEVARAQRENADDANELSVRLELQADCYSGVWASTVYAEGDLQPGDLEEAFTASEAVGDDRLQQQAGGRVDPDSFTHGTSEQRRGWFTTGYESGDPATCDTFSADSL
jgi:predicted metalloprotease